VLHWLDLQRATAFAQRDPRLLRRVYLSRVLSERDVARLLSVVPVGCGLRGVRTRFTGVRITARTVDAVVVRARAVLARSTLVCGHSAVGFAAAAGPSALRIELRRTPGGLRIASQRVLA
jgi:hypothetical protein